MILGPYGSTSQTAAADWNSKSWALEELLGQLLLQLCKCTQGQDATKSLITEHHHNLPLVLSHTVSNHSVTPYDFFQHFQLPFTTICYPLQAVLAFPWSLAFPATQAPRLLANLKAPLGCKLALELTLNTAQENITTDTLQQGQVAATCKSFTGKF